LIACNNYRRTVSGVVAVVQHVPYTLHYNTLSKTHPPIWRVFLSVNEKGEFYNVMTRINTRCSLLLFGSFQTKFPTPFLCTPQYVPIHGIRFSRLFRENAILSLSLLSPTKLASSVSRKTFFTWVSPLGCGRLGVFSFVYNSTFIVLLFLIACIF